MKTFELIERNKLKEIIEPVIKANSGFLIHRQSITDKMRNRLYSHIENKLSELLNKNRVDFIIHSDNKTSLYYIEVWDGNSLLYSNEIDFFNIKDVYEPGSN